MPVPLLEVAAPMTHVVSWMAALLGIAIFVYLLVASAVAGYVFWSDRRLLASLFLGVAGISAVAGAVSIAVLIWFDQR